MRILSYHRLGSSTPRNYLRQPPQLKLRKYLVETLAVAGGNVSVQLGKQRLRNRIPCLSIDGPNNPLTAVDDADSFGQAAWSNTNGAITSNDIYATVNLSVGVTPSDYLKLTNFGFSIPTGNIISGIVVSIERNTPSGVNIKDYRVRIVKGGAYSTTDRSDTNAWAANDEVVTYGNNADKWGETWTPADINASNFGVAIAAQWISASAPAANIDHVRIKVYHSSPSSGSSPTCRNLEVSVGSTILLGKVRTRLSAKAITVTLAGNVTQALSKIRTRLSAKILSIAAASNISIGKQRYKLNIKSLTISSGQTLSLGKLRARLTIKATIANVGVNLSLGKLREKLVVKSAVSSGAASISLGKLRTKLTIKQVTGSGAASVSLNKLRAKLLNKAITLSTTQTLSLGKLRNKLTIKAITAEIGGTVNVLLGKLRLKSLQKATTQQFSYATSINKIRGKLLNKQLAASAGLTATLGKQRCKLTIKLLAASAGATATLGKLREKLANKALTVSSAANLSIGKIREKLITKATTPSSAVSHTLNKLRGKLLSKAATFAGGGQNVSLNLNRLRPRPKALSIISHNLIAINKVRIRLLVKNQSVSISTADVIAPVGTLVWKDASKNILWKNAATQLLFKQI